MTRKGEKRCPIANAKAGATIKAWWANPVNREYGRQAIQEAVRHRVYPDRPCDTCGELYTPSNGASRFCEKHISHSTRSRRRRAQRESLLERPTGELAGTT